MRISSNNAPHTVNIMLVRSIRWRATNLIAILNFTKRVINDRLPIRNEDKQHKILKLQHASNLKLKIIQTLSLNAENVKTISTNAILITPRNKEQIKSSIKMIFI